MTNEQLYSDRAGDYDRHRPGYPDEAIDFVCAAGGMDGDSVLADIGSGTGISAAAFARRVRMVYAVEPNDAMRAIAESRHGASGSFVSVNATAEDTGLSPRSLDGVVTAQALHWFDLGRAREEFARVLKPDRSVALIWNIRLTHGSAFRSAYEEVIERHAANYGRVKAFDAALPEIVERFFGSGRFIARDFENRQDLSWPGLAGRTSSNSYAPRYGSAAHDAMIEDLRLVYDVYQSDGKVRLDYICRVYMGRLDDE